MSGGWCDGNAKPTGLLSRALLVFAGWAAAANSSADRRCGRWRGIGGRASCRRGRRGRATDGGDACFDEGARHHWCRLVCVSSAVSFERGAVGELTRRIFRIWPHSNPEPACGRSGGQRQRSRRYARPAMTGTVSASAIRGPATAPRANPTACPPWTPPTPTFRRLAGNSIRQISFGGASHTMAAMEMLMLAMQTCSRMRGGEDCSREGCREAGDDPDRSRCASATT